MKRLFVVVVLLSAVASGYGWWKYAQHEAERRLRPQRAAAAALAADAGNAATAHIQHTRIRSGATFSETLGDLAIEMATANALVEAARPVFNFRGLRPGAKLELVRSSAGELELLRCRVDADHNLWIERKGAAYHAHLKKVPSTTSVVTVSGRIRSSLIEGIVSAGENEQLALDLAEIFSFDLDFYTDPQPGDRFALVVEKKAYADGTPARYGRIFAAEYDNAGTAYTALLFKDEEGKPAYYAADGKSLRKAFLKSPLKFQARVSSHFSRSRYHPVLKRHRPHLGTDYAAPTGTPVQSIASGKVVSAGRSGGAGLMVRVKHSNGYESYYLHLSRIYVKAGQKVAQGQRIGAVGATGLATGPHLDFRLRRNGTFVNWEKLKLPPAGPVPAQHWAEFAAEREKWLPMLNAAQAEKVQARSETPEMPVGTQ